MLPAKALTPGSRLGSYEMVALLGVGGMGEVYRATDTKLKRQVAIKVLPAALTSDSDRLARFQREAEVLASLNHPHIAQIHGLEEADGVRALVMELVEGLTLADRIAQGPLTLDEALPIATQIAQALEAAHDQGIIHRDLKPANIKVRPDGTVKVLDFGLAKALERPDSNAGSAGASFSPTLSIHATQAGMILGTAAYMSPEQARGKAVDKRADIWAFGVVLYEMLTGKRAFEGQEATDILASVIKSEPAMEVLPLDTPFLIRRLLRHCLTKDPRQRLADIRDARIEISEALSVPEPERAQVANISHGGRERVAWIVAGASAIVVAAIATLFASGVINLREAAAVPPTVRFTIAPPPGVGVFLRPAVSPDGRRIVFTGSDGNLWVRALDAFSMQKLPGTEAGGLPFWSADSRSVAFSAVGKLKRIDIAGGPAVTVCDLPEANIRGGSWSADGVMLFGAAIGLQRVAAAGGVPVSALRNLPTGDLNPRFPHFLPDGQHFLFVTDRADGSRAIGIGSLDTGTSTELIANVDSDAAYAPPGVVLFLRGTTVMRQAFDAMRLKLDGDATPVAEGVGASGAGLSFFSVSTTGLLVYTTPAAVEKSRLVWVDRKGGVTPLALPPGAYGAPGLSPDGRQIALSITDPSGTHIWVHDIERGTLGKRTFEGINNFPLWTPDGQYITFSRGPNMVGPIMRVRADGSGSAEPLVTDEQRTGDKIPISWSPDGKQLTFQNRNDVMVRDADGTLHPALATPAREIEGRFAPSGHWIAYRSEETGRPEVYVQSYPTGNGKWQISTDGGAQPMWSPRGNELFYKSGNRMMVVEVETGTAFKAGVPRALFEMPMPERTPGDPARFIVSPDATRFLVLTTAPNDTAPAIPPLNVVLHWQAPMISTSVPR